MSRTTFAELGVPEDLVAVLGRNRIRTPFPIQAVTLPDALAGKDICGRAPTGSGKTLAFGLALAMRTPQAKPNRPSALVLVPTRELASQVERVLRPIVAARSLRVATAYGGVEYDKQRKALRHGVEILVACPGRLEDLIQQRDVHLDNVSIVVVDEADRMADMGFLPAVKRLLDRTRPDRQTMLYSATLDNDVDVLIKRYQNDPKRFQVDNADEKVGDITHVFWRAERDERFGLIADLIGKHTSTLVFCRTRHGADRLAKQLTRAGVEAAAIHGSRSQPQRDRALAAFQRGTVKALIATDVAARGIHVDEVACVVHYDPPATSKDYLHRSGRTGRAGANGTIVSFVGHAQARDVGAIQKELRMPQSLVEPDVMNGHRAKANGNGSVQPSNSSVRRSNGRRPNANRGPRGHRPRNAHR